MNFYLTILFTLLLSNCATHVQKQSSAQESQLVKSQPKSKQVAPPQAYQQNKQYVQALRQWKITGAIAVKHQQEGWQARLIWQEEKDHFSGRLYAYFAPEQVVIKGNSHRVRLFDEKGNQYQDASIEHMIQKSTGWRIPMDQMRYWVRGLYVPGTKFSASYNQEGYLKTLQQAGWQINYRDYLSFSGYQLPKKMELMHDKLRIRLVISRWDI